MFGALSPEGGLGTLGADLKQLLADPELDAFFRKTGGLKAELGTLAASLCSPDMIYQDKLSSVKARLEVLVVSVNLAEVLDKQGKAGDRKACQTTVDAIRQAKRMDLPPLLPVFQRQVAVLAGVDGIHPRTAAELASARDTLARMCQELEEAKKAQGGTTVGGGTRATGAGTSKAGTSKAGPKSKGSGASPRKSGAAASRSSVGTKSSVGTAITTGIATVLDINEVRSVQSIVGSIVNASDLPTNFQALLARAMDAVDVQHKANDVRRREDKQEGPLFCFISSHAVAVVGARCHVAGD